MNGDTVRRFEKVFAEYVGAKYAIAMCNGTATLHTALAALGVESSWEGYEMLSPIVAVPPLTMASTTIAVLHAGGVPVFVDVDPDTWLMQQSPEIWDMVKVPVSLYGLHTHFLNDAFRLVVDDAAQTLRPHIGGKDGGVGDAWGHFTSYSFQASKILALGEGGMLVTNDEKLAARARSFASLGYNLGDSSVIDPAEIKSPDHERHFSLGHNYRMADAVAELGLEYFDRWHFIDHGGDGPLMADSELDRRQEAAALYRDVVDHCSWLTPQHVPDGWQHDYWTYAVTVPDKAMTMVMQDAIVRHGGEMPYGAWRVTYQEPAFRHLAKDGTCPVAEDLQPRLLQFQTNDFESAERNADALAKAIKEIG